jgi:hypothetical protein
MRVMRKARQVESEAVQRAGGWLAVFRYVDGSTEEVGVGDGWDEEHARWVCRIGTVTRSLVSKSTPVRAEPRPEHPTRVYFVQAGESGPVKIGVTGNIEDRVRTMQTGSPQPLRVLATFPGGFDLEARLHRMFAPHRVHGEWFAPAPDLLQRLAEWVAVDCVDLSCKP